MHIILVMYKLMLNFTVGEFQILDMIEGHSLPHPSPTHTWDRNLIELGR